MKNRDSVLEDEAKHDRMQTAQEMLEEEGYEQAVYEFATLQLDDALRDAVKDDPADATAIAQFWCLLDDEIKAEIQQLIASRKAHPGLFFEPTVNVASFNTTIDNVINARARLVTEDK
jgi:hypothetical protein